MQAYEFSTKVTPDGKLVIPSAYIQNVRTGDSVRVIILVNEFSAANELEEQNLFPLEQVLTEIKAKPQNPAHVRSASSLLAKHLANAPKEFDPSFDAAAWNQEWDKVEAEMKAMEIADEKAEAGI